MSQIKAEGLARGPTRRGAWLLCLVPAVAMLCGLWWARQVWVCYAVYHAVVAGAWWVWRDRLGGPGGAGALGRGPGDAGSGWRGPAAVVLSLLGVAVLAWLRPVLGLGDLAGELADYGVPRAMLPVLTLYQSSVHVAFEEWFWRRLLAPRLGGVNDVLFGAYHVFIFLLFAHWPWVALACAALAVAGCVWRWVAGRDGLRWAIAAHATGSFGCMVVLGLW